MRFIFALLAASAFAISPAMAQDGGFYVGAGGGEASVTVDVAPGIPDFDASSTAFKLLGGYKFGKYFGAELEYIDAGDADDSWTVSNGSVGFNKTGVVIGSQTVKTTIGFSAWNASLLGVLPIGEQFDVFAKVGAIMWDADLDAKYLQDGTLVDRERDSDSGSDFSWGIGGSWYFLENFGARIEYQGFDIDEAEADLISASLLWLF